MPSSHPDSRWRGPLIALAAAAALLDLQPACAAAERREPIQMKAGRGFNYDPPSGLATINEPVVTQGSTLLRAVKATATDFEDDYKNSTWKFTGQVHLEFDGAVLDAEAATVVFVDSRLSSVEVQAASSPPSRQPKKAVHVEFKGAELDVETAAITFADGRIKTVQAQGAPALFSHQLKKTGRRASGRANRINYDASTTLLHLTDHAWFLYGANEVEPEWVDYNLTNGAYNTGAFTGTHDRAERVPAPRTPDRTSAK